MSADKRRLRRKIERDLNDSGWVDKRIRELLEQVQRIRRRVDDGLVYAKRLRSGYTRKAQRARYIEPHFTHVLVNPNPNRKKK